LDDGTCRKFGSNLVDTSEERPVMLIWDVESI
jgi:hypothetical protein